MITVLPIKHVSNITVTTISRRFTYKMAAYHLYFVIVVSPFVVSLPLVRHRLFIRDKQ